MEKRTLVSAFAFIVVLAGCYGEFTPNMLATNDAGTPCSNGVKDGNETDVDCGGGTCMPCALGKACLSARDCQSAVCTNNACVGALVDGGVQNACTNGLKDGNETDVDCGGGTCVGCANGKACKSGADCASGTCTNNVCASSAMQLNTFKPTLVATPGVKLTWPSGGWSIWDDKGLGQHGVAPVADFTGSFRGPGGSPAGWQRFTIDTQAWNDLSEADLSAFVGQPGTSAGLASFKVLLPDGTTRDYTAAVLVCPDRTRPHFFVDYDFPSAPRCR